MIYDFAKGVFLQMRRVLNGVRRALGSVETGGHARQMTSAEIAKDLAKKGVVFKGQGTFYGAPLVKMAEGSVIELGDEVVLCSDSNFTALALNHPLKLSTLRPGAQITIGKSTGISGGTIVAAKSVTIGNEVLMGANVSVFDTDFHPIAATNRRHSDDIEKIGVAPVVIGNNVFIGVGSIILKGTQIGDDSVVGAGSVVHGVFPERVILAGNPAKVIGSVPL
ncbi:transferase hexapeptide repeat containing protein [Burkholderia sp. lig30]|jgi:acetyltransferase-like isoleucine patch superfamily enzyme|uniref:acyltransferase n=1 Tax=Burkholderia sp. lig30 TaxID=1192124 RepID=UPI000461A861|nr:acyltransferase [Burkholderia sp. lig30]KDB08745.1 transferase hexapeptide repeat containing protein [Burkholderia sp. lig30]